MPKVFACCDTLWAFEHHCWAPYEDPSSFQGISKAIFIWSFRASCGMSETLINTWTCQLWILASHSLDVRVPFWWGSKFQNSVSRALQWSYFRSFHSLCSPSSCFSPPRDISPPKHTQSLCTRPNPYPWGLFVLLDLPFKLGFFFFFFLALKVSLK